MQQTTRNKTPLKKHVSTKHQSDNSTNQYAILTDPEIKTSTNEDTSGPTRSLTIKNHKIPPTLDSHETNKRFEHLERTIKSICERQTLSEEMSHHALQVMLNRFDALNTQLLGNTSSKTNSSIQPSSIWSTVVRGTKSLRQDQSAKIVSNDKTVTFGAKQEYVDTSTKLLQSNISTKHTSSTIEDSNFSSTTYNENNQSHIVIDKIFDEHPPKTSNNPGNDMNIDKGLNVDVQNQDDEETKATFQNLYGNHK